MRFVLIAFLALAALPTPAGAGDASLDALLGQLSRAPTDAAARAVERAVLGRFLQTDSASVSLLMARAQALLGASDPGTAAQLLTAVTRMAPDYAEGWHLLGKLQMAAGHDEAAMVSLQKAVTLNPREFDALVELGDMLEQYGAKPAALADFRRALAIDPHLEGLDRRIEVLARDVEGEKI
jgi:Flp pilus assembly protein TadD